MITIAMEGAPEGMERVQRLDTGQIPERLTITYYGRHHHFERTEKTVEVGADDVPVFQWTYSTAIAE
jgi:uncharacterized protein DUF5988